MKNNLFLPTFLFATVTTSVTLSSTLTDTPYQRNLQVVRKEINTLKQHIAQQEAVSQEARSAIRASEQAIQQATQTLRTLEQRQHTSEKQFTRLQEQINRIRHQAIKVQEEAAHALAHQYKRRGHPSPQSMLSGKNTDQESRDMIYHQHINRYQQQLAHELQQRQQELQGLLVALEQELVKLETLTHKKSQEKKQLIQRKANKEKAISQLTNDIHQHQTQLDKLQADEKQLTDLINQINRVIQQRRAQEAAARRIRIDAAKKENERRRQLAAAARQEGRPIPQEAKKPIDTNATSDSVTSEPPEATPFGQRGQLKLPTSGKIIGKFGSPRSGGTSWKGIFIQSPVGQAVHSVDTGRVVYSDNLRGFGKAVIVDHGKHYLTVYTGLATIRRSLGEMVNAGDSLGTTGQAANGDTGLYFEIRYLGKPIDPLTWAR